MIGLQQHMNQRGGSVESSVQDAGRALSTKCNVLWADQFPRHLPTDDGPSILRPEEPIPGNGVCVYGQHSNCYNQRPHAAPMNCP
jgi:hypothetical protein